MKSIQEEHGNVNDAKMQKSVSSLKDKKMCAN